MFTEIKDNIKEVMRLAGEREQARDQYEAQFGQKKWGTYLPEEKNLNNYLLTLDRDTLEVIEVLMLLGRNDVHRLPDQTPEENFQKLSEVRYHRHPDQEVAVYYLSGKTPLKDFIQAGLAYLGQEI